MSSPLAIVKEKFGSKDKLVDKIVDLLAKDAEESKDDMRKRLLGVANQKLLHLHQVATTTQEKYGSHDKLVEATAGALGVSKDKDQVAKLGQYSDARLLDIERTARKRNTGKSA